MIKIVKGIIFVTLIVNIVGCASYYSHYGSFSAQNSKGEERKFVVSWKTAEYPSWAIQDNQATEFVLETQCSERKWALADLSTDQNECTEAHEGIVACGNKTMDLSLSGRPLPDDKNVCVSVTDNQQATKIVDLESRVLISVSCLPVATTRKEEGENINIDYLKASVVPYSVATRKVERYSFADKAPLMSSKICEGDK